MLFQLAELLAFLFSDTTLASCRRGLINRFSVQKKKKKLKMQNRWEQREAKRIKRNLEKVEAVSFSYNEDLWGKEESLGLLSSSLFLWE